MKNSNARTQLLPVVIIIIGFLIAIISQYNNYTNNQSKLKAEVEAYEHGGYSQYSDVSFDTIYKARKENLIAAKDNYIDKVYIFSGEITYIDESWDMPYLHVEQKFSNYGLEVTVYFMKSQTEYIKTLKNGDIVKFYGKIDSLDPIFGFMIIRDGIVIQ